METIIVVVIIVAAATYTIRSLYRGASAGEKSCGCEDGCPISDKCNPEEKSCVLTDKGEEVVR